MALVNAWIEGDSKQILFFETIAAKEGIHLENYVDMGIREAAFIIRRNVNRFAN